MVLNIKKIITAIGNENLNIELNKKEDLKVVTSDIQYKEGIIEALEKYDNIDFLILNSLLQGNINLEELIIEINIINKKIKIIIILENKNEELEKKLYEKNVYKIIYNNEIEINDLIKIINEKDSTNEDLREEINKLKKIILEKELENNLIKNNNFINKKSKKVKKHKGKIIFKEKIRELINKNKIKNNNLNIIKENKINKEKIICITGPSGVGKSIISINLAKANIYSKRKILLVDGDFINNSLSTILGAKIPHLNIQKNKENCFFNLIKINKKIDLLCLKNILEEKNKEIIFNNILEENNENYFYNLNYSYKNTYKKINSSNDINSIKSEKIIQQIKDKIINQKEIYDYIIIDTNFSLTDFTKELIKISDINLFISDTNLLEINKSIKILDKFINIYKINKNKFNILFNKYNSNSIAPNLLKNIFNEFNVIGYLSYNKLYNKLINKNNKNNFINKKIRNEYLKINNFLNKN